MAAVIAKPQSTTPQIKLPYEYERQFPFDANEHTLATINGKVYVLFGKEVMGELLGATLPFKTKLGKQEKEWEKTRQVKPERFVKAYEKLAKREKTRKAKPEKFVRAYEELAEKGKPGFFEFATSTVLLGGLHADEKAKLENLLAKSEV